MKGSGCVCVCVCSRQQPQACEPSQDTGDSFAWEPALETGCRVGVFSDLMNREPKYRQRLLDLELFKTLLSLSFFLSFSMGTGAHKHCSFNI